MSALFQIPHVTIFHKVTEIACFLFNISYHSIKLSLETEPEQCSEDFLY